MGGFHQLVESVLTRWQSPRRTAVTSAAQTLPVSRVAVSARRSPPRVKRKRWEWRCSRGSPTALAGFSSWPPTRQAPASANRSVPSTSCWAWSRKMTETSRSPRTPQRYSRRACAKLPYSATTTSVPNTSYSPCSRRRRIDRCSPAGRDDLGGLRSAASADPQANCRASPSSRIFGAETPHHQPAEAGEPAEVWMRNTILSAAAHAGTCSGLPTERCPPKS